MLDFRCVEESNQAKQSCLSYLFLFAKDHFKVNHQTSSTAPKHLAVVYWNVEIAMQTHTNDRILGCKWSQIDEKKHHTSAWIISNQLANTIDDGNRPYFLLILQWSLQNFRWVHGYRTPKLNSNARLRHSTVAHGTCAILADFNTACLLLARVAAKASFCGKIADIDYEMGSDAAIKPVLGHGPCNHWFNDRGCHFLCNTSFGW